MAISRTLTASLLLSILLLHLAEAHQTTSIDGVPTPATLPQTIDCGAACKGRCKVSSRPHLCERACGSCCAKCNCVPPGTSGNHDYCPCYANLTTHNHIRKCP